MKRAIEVFVGILCLLLLVSCSNSTKNEEYLKDLEESIKSSYVMASNAETIGVEYIKTWKETIQLNSRNMKIVIDGQEYSDFNESLQAKRDFLEENGIIDIVNEKTDAAGKGFKKVQEQKNKHYSDEYSQVKEFYIASEDFKEYCLNPSGSLASYTDGYNEKLNNIKSLFNALKIEFDLVE